MKLKLETWGKKIAKNEKTYVYYIVFFVLGVLLGFLLGRMFLIYEITGILSSIQIEQLMIDINETHMVDAILDRMNATGQLPNG
jgi:hypothetical protein